MPSSVLDTTASVPVAAPRADRFRTLPSDHFDAIVVGAGLGGLTAAALLARAGRSVLVIDSHYAAGGNATVFHRPGYTFDVGVHYVADCGPDGLVRRVLRAADADRVAFREMDADGFDTLIFPDFVFRVPKGIDAYRDRLIERFPREAHGIDRYVAAVRGIVSLFGVGRGLIDSAKVVWRARAGLRYAGSTLERVFDACRLDPVVRAVLAAQGLTYAEPPSRASFPIHAGVIGGYLLGAYYPAGGAQAISDALAAAIERQGGKILLYATATRILVENGSVSGVELDSRHLGRRVVRAPLVISNADLKETLTDLVDASTLRTRTLARVRRFEMAPAIAVVHVGLARDLHRDGLPSTNYWVHPTYDVERLYAETRAGRFVADPVCYVSSATLKDPDNLAAAPRGCSNVQLMTIVPSQPEAWGVTPEQIRTGTYRHVAAYVDTKQRLTDRLLAIAERAIPGLTADLSYVEMSTPLTHTRFTHSTGGTGYGLAHVPSQSLWRRPGARTEVDGLWLCGASTITGHGVVGAMMSGVMAASRLLHRSVPAVLG